MIYLAFINLAHKIKRKFILYFKISFERKRIEKERKREGKKV